MRTVTISANLVGHEIVFIGAHADRIARIKTHCVPIRTRKGIASYMLGDLEYLLKDIIADGWALKVGP